MLRQFFQSYPTLKTAEPVISTVLTEAILAAYCLGLGARIPFEIFERWIAFGVSIATLVLASWVLWANRPRMGLERSLAIAILALLVYLGTLRGSMSW